MSLKPRKLPRQQRSRATVEAILDATIRILLTRGYQGTTTIAVAERAGISVGSLYQYFPNKDAMIAALVKRHAAEVMSCLDKALAAIGSADLEEALRAFARAGIAAHRVHPALHKILVEQVPRIGQMKSAMDTSREVTRRLLAWFKAHPQMRVPDPEHAAFVIETVVEAMTHRTIVEKARHIEDAELENEITDILASYFASRRLRTPC